MIYSIGHGNKTIDDFLHELQSFQLHCVVDVRSVPFSKYHSQYNRAPLEISLRQNDIAYVYLGNKLGGLPSDSSCYVDDKASYDIIKDKPCFREGLKQLVLENEKYGDIVVLCSESNPEECHRSKLIGRELDMMGYIMSHIVAAGKIKDQVTVMNEWTGGENLVDLFGYEKKITSKKKYK